jgi:predicted HNH restriction endonuclease
MPGDDVVIYISSYGFFATATVNSHPKSREGWTNRYGASLATIDLIEPAISLGAIVRYVPSLTWARYPRSITTPNSKVAASIRKLIQKRRKAGLPDLDNVSLSEANIDELRKVAMLAARPTAAMKVRKAIYRVRSLAIKRYVLKRADGICEGCREPAPFQSVEGGPYLEPHHTTRLADEGPDHPADVIALCPNCHQRAHRADDAVQFNHSLIEVLSRIERRI